MRKTPPFDHHAYMGGAGFAGVHGYNRRAASGSSGGSFIGSAMGYAQNLAPAAALLAARSIPGFSAVDAATGGMIGNTVADVASEMVGKKRKYR